MSEDGVNVKCVTGRNSLPALNSSGIQMAGRMPDRPCIPKHMVRVSWEYLAEVLVCGIFNSQLQQNFSSNRIGALSLIHDLDHALHLHYCGCKVVGECCGVIPWTGWRTPTMKRAIELKKVFGPLLCSCINFSALLLNCNHYCYNDITWILTGYYSNWLVITYY